MKRQERSAALDGIGRARVTRDVIEWHGFGHCADFWDLVDFCETLRRQAAEANASNRYFLESREQASNWKREIPPEEEGEEYNAE